MVPHRVVLAVEPVTANWSDARLDDQLTVKGRVGPLSSRRHQRARLSRLRDGSALQQRQGALDGVQAGRIVAKGRGGQAVGSRPRSVAGASYGSGNVSNRGACVTLPRAAATRGSMDGRKTKEAGVES